MSYATCDKYLGDNDATCPQLTCIRRKHHDGLCDNVRGDEEEAMKHVDDFIDDPTSDPYAASWFESFRRPAIDKLKEPDTRKLFTTYQGQRYLVTGCSRLGDVWLHANLDYDGMSYQHRVDVDACSEWSASP